MSFVLVHSLSLTSSIGTAFGMDIRHNLKQGCEDHMETRRIATFAIAATALFLSWVNVEANPWNGKVVFQAFWWDAWNERYPHDWYTYLAKLAPRLKAMGFDGMWIPPPAKGNAGRNGMGYDIYDHYDLGDKDQKGNVGTRFGDKDSLLRLVAVAHANGLEIYPDIVLNHLDGGNLDDSAPPGDKHKKFRYVGYSGTKNGRWTKDHWNFHPNPDHQCSEGGALCEKLVGQDICYEDGQHGGGTNGKYMRDKAREWFVWLKKQIDADGFRFDAVKHYPAYVVEDLLFNAMGPHQEYFAVGEFVGGRQELDDWTNYAQNRAGTFDFSLREALAQIIEAKGFFDMGSLPNYQQQNRFKTVPFINNHDTWRGAFWDSEPGSLSHNDRSGDFRQNGEEKVGPTIDPDNDRTDVSYAAAFSVDGSPTVFYEDLFVNYGPDRFKADPSSIQTRGYLVNLVWAHQKLNFKDGAYKVRYQNHQDLLVIDRSGKALIGLNDHGSQHLSAKVQTDFPPHTPLHDYSGATNADVETDDNGQVAVSVPPMSYAVWGPAGITGGFSPVPRRTVQEFQFDDDLGDAGPNSLGYGGRIKTGELRTVGSIWAAANSKVNACLYVEGDRRVNLRIYKPDTNGQKKRDQGLFEQNGDANIRSPLCVDFTTDREGYHQLAASGLTAGDTAARGYLKVAYQAPPVSTKF